MRSCTRVERPERDRRCLVRSLLVSNPVAGSAVGAEGAVPRFTSDPSQGRLTSVAHPGRRVAV